MRLGIRPLWAALLAAMCGLLVPGAAWAEPPANDDFANRQVLPAGFPEGKPVEVKASNVEATKEEGEFIPSGPAPAGHSVWFEWEAKSTDWVTIGACDDDFATIAMVFTGSELNNLAPAASGNADEGPDCPYGQRQYTFKATSGTQYVIVVDGNIFHLPEAPTPVTEGEIILRIEETPPPPNDDFANAEPLEGKIDEEPGGNRFYFAHAQGYNWGATTEPGEPLDGPSYGATVWYTWTAPETAKYHFGGPCCGLGLNWDLYTGSSLENLQENLAATGSAEVSVIGGTTNWIAVYGTPQSEGAEPAMASFQFNISASLPPLPTVIVDPAPPRDTTPPQTAIARTKLLSASGIVKFWLSSSESGGGFLCRLDKAPFKPCSSPKGYRHLKPGRHVFRVEAVDAAGNVDSSPAVARIKVPRKQGNHRR